jgi:predicted porin
MALAVAGVLAPAAAMAQSSVEIYGRANLAFDQWKATGSATGADFESRLRVVDGSSRVGFRINESLGGGLRAFAVIETGVNIDNGGTTGQGGQANGSSAVWASRDSYLGLGGGWGDIRLGRQSIWWSNGVIAQTGANYLYTAADSVITGHMLAAPVTRQPNVISYNSPTFGGFNFSASFSPDDQERGTLTGAAEKGHIFGLTGRYTSGAIRAQVDWATRSNASQVDARDIDGLKVGVGWAYAPGSQISGIWGNIDHSNFGTQNAGEAAIVTAFGGAGAVDAEVTFWLLNWEHMIGQWQLLAQFYKAGDVETSFGDINDSDVTAITLGAKYFLSKRTGVYVNLHSIRNGDFAWADHTGGAVTSGPLTVANRGADPRIIGVGVMHNF